MISFRFRSVTAMSGLVRVHVTTFLPLGLTKEIHVQLTPADAQKLIDRAAVVLRELAAADAKRLPSG